MSVPVGNYGAPEPWLQLPVAVPAWEQIASQVYLISYQPPKLELKRNFKILLSITLPSPLQSPSCKQWLSIHSISDIRWRLRMWGGKVQTQSLRRSQSNKTNKPTGIVAAQTQCKHGAIPRVLAEVTAGQGPASFLSQVGRLGNRWLTIWLCWGRAGGKKKMAAVNRS